MQVVRNLVVQLDALDQMLVVLNNRTVLFVHSVYYY